VSGGRSRCGRALAAAALLTAAVGLAGCSRLVILHDPLSAAEHNDLGVAYESAGRTDLAAKQYRKSLRLDSRQTRTWVNLGNAEAASGRWRAAEKAYRRALGIDENEANAMNNLAVALLRQGRAREEARLWATRAVAAGGERDSLYRATLAEVERSLK
jgi:Flp pilus assembly protein TadD